MARFTETVNIQPQTFSTGQPELLMSLSDKLGAFAAQQTNKQAEKVIADATLQGQTAGIEQQQAGGALELKEEKFIGGVSAKAFNTAAREGYIKSLDNDVMESFTNLAAENSQDLQSYNTGAEALAKGFMAGVDPASRPAVELSIDSMISRQRPRIQAAQAQAIVDQGNQDQAINTAQRGRLAEAAAFDGDAESALLDSTVAIDSINNRSDLSDVQKSEQIRDVNLKIRESFSAGELSRTYDAEGSQAALDQLTELSGDRPQGFTPDEWDSFISKEQTKINRKVAREKQDIKFNAEAAQRDLSISRGLMLTADGARPANPAGSSQDRKDINNYYDSVSEQWQQLPVEQQIQANVDIVKSTGLVPSTLSSSISAVMRSGNAEQAGLMADIVSRIQEQTPASINDLTAESRAMSLQISDALRAGMDIETATAAAHKATFGITQSEKDVIAISTQEVSKNLPSSLQTFADSDLDEGGFDRGIFYNVPDVPPMMAADYRGSFGRFMDMTGGNAKQAQKLAYDSIKSVWGVTETGGPRRFSKYAPETIYAVPNSNNNWIEEQFNGEMVAAGAEGAIIAFDKDTARADQPSYPVFVNNQDTGLLEPMLDDNNENVRWKPEYKLTDEYQDLTDEPGKAIESAKEQRARNLTRRANVINNGLRARILNAGFDVIPANERNDFLKSDEGKARADRMIDSMLSAGKIDSLEASEARKAFGV